MLNVSYVDINSQDNEGLTCLHYAVCAENINIIKELLKQKTINVNLVDLEGFKPSEMTNNEEIINLIFLK